MSNAKLFWTTLTLTPSAIKVHILGSISCRPGSDDKLCRASYNTREELLINGTASYWNRKCTFH